jgi:hypothetical protein
MRGFFHDGRAALLAPLLILLLAPAALAELSVVLTYDTRPVGEIEPCG